MARLTRARSLLDKIVGLLARLLGDPAPADLIPRAVRVGARGDLPPRLCPRRLYLVGEPVKWAVFRCPCGTGHQIDLNLAHPGPPRWSVAFDLRNRPSLQPSVDVQAERRCHFWLTAGQVRWCQDAANARQARHSRQSLKRQLTAAWWPRIRLAVAQGRHLVAGVAARFR